MTFSSKVLLGYLSYFLFKYHRSKIPKYKISFLKFRIASNFKDDLTDNKAAKFSSRFVFIRFEPVTSKPEGQHPPL